MKAKIVGIKEVKTEPKKLTVSQITALFFYRYRDMSGWRVPDRVLQSGNIVHSRLGYNQLYQFRRVYIHNDEVYHIVGMPDKLEGDMVVELKTYSGFSRKEQKMAGIVAVQIYLWLTGLENGKVVYFNTKTEKFDKEVKVSYDPELVKKIFTLAIGLQKDIDNFVEKYREKTKEIEEIIKI